MARKALIEKAKKTPKFKVRQYTRCFNCGRPRSVLRIFQLCRMCFRKFAYQGYISGFRKISW